MYISTFDLKIRKNINLMNSSSSFSSHQAKTITRLKGTNDQRPIELWKKNLPKTMTRFSC